VASTSFERLIADIRTGTVTVWDDGTGSYRAEPTSSRPHSVYADLVRRGLIDFGADGRAHVTDAGLALLDEG
jgi:hypothetical protein